MLPGAPILVLAVALSASHALASGPVPGPPPLEDQNGKQDSLAAHFGRPVVLLAIDADHLRNLQGWESDIRALFDGLDFIRVVDIPQKPGTRPEGVARKLREKVPADVPVLIDMDGVWATVYGLDTQEMNVVLFDRDGRQVARVNGRREPALVERIAVEIEGKLGVARKPAAAPR
jgi:hypothetical protein